MATRRRTLATGRGRPGDQGSVDREGASQNEFNDLKSQLSALTSTVAALVARDQDRSDPGPDDGGSAAAIDRLAQAMARLARVDDRDEEWLPDSDHGPEPELPEVAEIEVADPRFASLLDVSTYRLYVRTARVAPKEISKLYKRATELRPRLGKAFSGCDAMDVLPFLSRLQEIANEGGVSERMLLRLFTDMLIEPALTAFRAAKPMSYPAAIK
jgi:hypothetical protein